jgi:hypothetical protein
VSTNPVVNSLLCLPPASIHQTVPGRDNKIISLQGEFDKWIPARDGKIAKPFLQCRNWGEGEGGIRYCFGVKLIGGTQGFNEKMYNQRK